MLQFGSEKIPLLTKAEDWEAKVALVAA